MTSSKKITGAVFTTTPADAEIIRAIVVRAVAMQPKYEPMDCLMDIKACHANGNPLKLKELLEADDFNFAHDVFGIAKHIDRRTGELMHYFRPRFSA